MCFSPSSIFESICHLLAKLFLTESAIYGHFGCTRLTGDELAFNVRVSVRCSKVRLTYNWVFGSKNDEQKNFRVDDFFADLSSFEFFLVFPCRQFGLIHFQGATENRLKKSWHHWENGAIKIPRTWPGGNVYSIFEISLPYFNDVKVDFEWLRTSTQECFHTDKTVPAIFFHP